MRRLTVCLLILFLVGCSASRQTGKSARTPSSHLPQVSASRAPATPSGARATPTVQPTPTAPAPVLGGHVTELIPIYPRSLDPLLADNVVESRVESLLFDSLMSVDPRTRLPVPDLAAGYSVSPDGLTYTFRLRKDVRWHDGDALSASDVVWTYRALAMSELEAPLLPYTGVIRSVRALDGHTVQFRLSRPYSAFLARLATVPVIPRAPFAKLRGARLRAKLENWPHPIGTGPFVFGSATPGISIELVTNPDYFRGRPFVDRYELRVMRSSGEIREALISGRADLAWLPPTLARSLGEQDFITQTPMDTSEVTYVFFNVGQDQRHGSPLADVRVRRALAYATDQAAVARALAGSISPIASFQSPVSPAYESSGGSSAPGFDPSLARQMLERAGWKDRDGDGVREKGGRKLSVTLYFNEVPPGYPSVLGTSYAPAARTLAAEWRSVGVGVRVVAEPWDRLAYRLFDSHAFDAAVLTIGTDAVPDQSYLWASRSRDDAFNVGGYSDRPTDRLLAEGLEERAPRDRAGTYARLDERLYARLPALPLGATRVLLVRSKRLVGPNPDFWGMVQHVGVYRWYVQDGR